MAPSTESVLRLFDDNSREDSVEASKILLRFASNILTHPTEDKYRRIRLSNDIVQEKLLPVSGALECLFDMGFQEDGEFLTLPQTSALDPIKVIHDEIQREVDVLTNSTAASGPAPPDANAASSKSSSERSTPSRPSPPAEPSPVRPSPVRPSPPQEVSQRPSPSRPSPPIQVSQRTQSDFHDFSVTEPAFLAKLQSNLAHVKMYEDAALQRKAGEIIPIGQLHKEADIAFQEAQSSQQDDGQPHLDKLDFLLLALLAWFKNSFFKWVDAPNCPHCNGNSTHMGMVSPTSEELHWGASRVESYRCSNCNVIVRFPRYNHPGKLLETRRGRCGEWANCFTLCCRAMGMEARYVLDWTDHVWTEVFSQSQRRWLHCDPCENVCDKPLLYEAGWGKKLSYVIAFSKDEVVDVTWRYSAKHAEVLSRRNECRESWLGATIFRLWSQMVSRLPQARQMVMKQRMVVELVEFVTPKSAMGQGLGGRTTGSLAWRQARGELGGGETGYVIRPTQEERDSESLHIRYNCARDYYDRVSASGERSPGWASYLFQATGVSRKEENDWRQAYLARTEGTESGSATWKFDFTDTDLKVKSMELVAKSATFENGAVVWTVYCDSTCHTFRGEELNARKTLKLGKCKTLTLTATLSQGHGSNAWQHAQLFRQALDQTGDFPLEIRLHLV